ncbi:hypothetical protein H0274_11130 [Altererythrobacter sp. CC-YST694]|uniref:OB-fold putative lipoprotein n=1 Tax=Altererythrobacter sp. CC-YST694 TaxID=2755038 RepID=UPI001D022371|nr:OB-fold putative lipoprotein [Altererythrobacter sp. CC-YST694]MCB5425814.1 hypothetical protein [Altererythrobacter sp. CC-YST694]
MSGEGGQPNKTGWLRIGSIVVGALVVLMVIGARAGGDESKGAGGVSGSDTASAAAPPLEVTADELSRAYDANEAAARQHYAQRPLLVSGKIERIDLDFRNRSVLVLGPSNQLPSVQASLTEATQGKAASLFKGQNIRLLCQNVSEVAGSQILRDCEF